jgi:uncharacterized protein (DUF2236 family)
MVRSAAGHGIRNLLTAPEVDGAASPGQPEAGADGGLFGPDSVTWRVHGHLCVLVGGLRSLLVQTLHPLAMAGVAEHSRYRTDPLGRLQRTGAFIATTTYGTRAQATAAIKAVRGVHERVRGVAPDGRPYSASDPGLLAWVHHVEVQSFLLAYQRLGPGLHGGDADRYVTEMAELGWAMGVRQRLTGSGELDRWVYGHPEMRATPQARGAVRFLLAPPLPVAARAPYAVLMAAAISMVPFPARLRLGLLLPGPVTGRLAAEPAARALVAAMGWAMGPPPALVNAQARLGVSTGANPPA